ncbi:MAG TPA: DUF3187 family protein, partial [Anaeromyxobacteraceae bacterium]
GAAGGGEVEAAPPLPWREPAPPARMFLQLAFEGPAVVEPGTLRAEAQLSYANSILVAASPTLALDVDLESAGLTGLFRYGLWRGVEAQLGLPVMADYGGFLDGPIEAFERALGATSMPGRLDRPRGLARFRLTRPDGSGVWRDGAGTGLGDIWAGLKAHLLDGAGALPALSLRAVVKVPTGRPPFGSGEVDLGASLSARWTLGRVGLSLQLDAAAPTAGLREVGLATRPYGAGQLGAAVAVSGAVSLHAQWATHLSPFATAGLAPLDEPTHYLLAGASVALSGSLELEAAGAENVFSPAWGADFTLLLGLRARP